MRLSGIAKAATVILAGALVSRIVYPITHGTHRRLPELYGIGAGCLLINCAHWWLFRDDTQAARLFVVQALVGLGVAGNRALLELGV